MHTPGPWFFDDSMSGAEIGYRAIVDDEGVTICNPSPMGEANARLIAQAPALLAALQDMLRYAEGFEDADHVIAAREAVARATLECRVTSDGYRLFRLPSGEWVDDIDPACRDLTFDVFPDDAVSDESRSFGPWGQR